MMRMFLKNGVADIVEDPTKAPMDVEVELDGVPPPSMIFLNMFSPVTNQAFVDMEDHVLKTHPTAIIRRFLISPKDFRALTQWVTSPNPKGYVLSINGNPASGMMRNAPVVPVLGRFNPAPKPCTCGCASVNGPKHSPYCDSLK